MAARAATASRPVALSNAESATSLPPTNTRPPLVTMAPGRADCAEPIGQGHALERRHCAELRRIAERHLPRDVATIQVERDQVRVRRLQDRHAVHKPGLGSVDPLGIDFVRATGLLAGVVRRLARRSAWRGGGLHLENARAPRGLDEQAAGLRIERAAAPVGAAPHARPRHRALQRRRRVERARAGTSSSPPAAAAFSSGVRSNASSSVTPCVVERRRLGGERLRRPRLLRPARRCAARPLFDRPHRMAGDAIEHEREALLGELHDGVDALAVDA